MTTSPTATTYARVVSGTVVETFTPPAGLAISDCFAPAVAMQFVAVPGWQTALVGYTYSGGTFAAPAPVVPSLVSLKAALIAAATNATNAVVAQVAPDQTHLAAYLNAAAILGPTATLPTVDPLKSAFTALATANGYGSNLSGFATLVLGVASTSISLSALVSALSAQTAAANDVIALKAALTTFQGGLSNLVDSLNGAGLTITIAAPAAITIPGINA